MKKSLLLVVLCAVFAALGMQAQEEQELTYVEDPAQGYLFNRFKENWFITGEGGVGMYFSPGDVHRKVSDRFAPAAGLYVGKWFSPVIGLRIGGSYLQLKGLSDVPGIVTDRKVDGMYKEKINLFGIAGDFLLNLTNWWCGYKPDRKYNAMIYGGFAGYWCYQNNKGEGWKYDHDRVPAVRCGIINSFNLSEQVALSLDIRWTGVDNHRDEFGEGWNKTSHDVQAYLGLTYKFKRREWYAPVVPVCPEPENCDPLRARLAAADARIADLEAQLRDCLNRPTEVVEEANAPLCTIYYPINIYRLTKKDVELLTSCAQVMKDNPSKHYVLTGWADNYTGTDEINVRLRHNRVNGVEKQLLKLGVPQSQMTATINNGNLCDLGEKYVALDRAVTIEEGN